MASSQEMMPPPGSVVMSRRGSGLSPVALLWIRIPWVLVLVLGCGPKHHREAADREVYRILAAKQATVLGSKRGFSIEREPGDPLEGLDAAPAPVPAADPPARGNPGSEEEGAPSAVPQDGVPRQRGARRLSLRDALRVAARRSREYHTRKEQLYLSALDLSLERHLWTPQWAGALGAGATDGDGDNTVEGSGWLSMSQLLALGGEVTVSLATDLLRHTTGDPRKSATTALAVEVLQPLWRNAGRLVARENLTQAERDTVYNVRSFARFRKTFCFQIASDYYGVLRLRDAVSNQWQNYERVRREVARTTSLADAGRLPEFQVDQARQDELAARDSWVQALRRYRERLDQFKVRLALPADAPVELDPGEVEALRRTGLREVPLTRDQAIRLALLRRFDLMNTHDQVADAERKVVLAVNGLGPDVDLRLAANVPSKPNTKAAKLQFHHGTYSAALDATLPLDRKAERNAYRRSLIALEQARRQADENRDDVMLSVRQAWRSLQETATRYRIQEESLRLADRRVESTGELLQAGRAATRDVLEALRAQVNAKNSLTGALIDHTLARLALWRDTELLRVDEGGVWQEVTEADVQE